MNSYLYIYIQNRRLLEASSVIAFQSPDYNFQSTYKLLPRPRFCTVHVEETVLVTFYPGYGLEPIYDSGLWVDHRKRRYANLHINIASGLTELLKL